MAEGEGRNEGGEDLFEDLDKFFAPIQDVDWPETAEPRATSTPLEPGPADQARETEPDEPGQADTAAFEEPIRIEDLEASEAPTRRADARAGGPVRG